MIATSADGTHIAWTEQGPRDGSANVAAVMLHSLGSSGAMWTPQIAPLAAVRRVIAVDTRGHGRSQAPTGSYSLDQLGRDVLAVVDHLGVEQFHVIGLSLGGQMAMWLATHATERVHSIVLANTAPKIGTDESWQSRIEAVRSGGMRSIRDAVLARWFTSHFAGDHPDRFAEMAAIFDATDPAGYIGCCAALRDSDLGPVVGAIAVPTLIIGAELDLATPPAQARWLHEHITGSELAVLDDAGHISNLEQTQAFTDLVVDFLAR